MSADMDQTSKNSVPLCQRFALSPEQASSLCGIGMTSLRAAIRAKKLRAHKHGTKTIILPGDLKSWLESLPSAWADGGGEAAA